MSYAFFAQQMIFGALGIRTNHPLASMHKYIYLTRPLISELSVCRLLEWVNLLLSSNRKLKLFPERIFNDIMITRICLILDQSYKSSLVEKRFNEIFCSFK